MTTGTTLKSKRMDLGLSVRAAAERIGVSHETLRSVEHGARPRVDTGKLIADFYGLVPSDLWPVEEAA